MTASAATPECTFAHDTKKYHKNKRNTRRKDRSHQSNTSRILRRRGWTLLASTTSTECPWVFLLSGWATRPYENRPITGTSAFPMRPAFYLSGMFPIKSGLQCAEVLYTLLQLRAGAAPGPANNQPAYLFWMHVDVYLNIYAIPFVMLPCKAPAVWLSSDECLFASFFFYLASPRCTAHRDIHRIGEWQTMVWGVQCKEALESSQGIGDS